MDIPKIRLRIRKGATFSWLTALEGADGLPLPMAGYAVRAQIRRDVADRAPREILASMVSAGEAHPVDPAALAEGEAVIVEAEGSIRLSMTPDQTQRLPITLGADVWRWDCKLISDTGTTVFVAEGLVHVYGDTTRG